MGQKGKIHQLIEDFFVDRKDYDIRKYSLNFWRDIVSHPHLVEMEKGKVENWASGNRASVIGGNRAVR